MVDCLYQSISEKFQIYRLLGLTRQVYMNATVACCFLFRSPTQLLSNVIVGVYPTEEVGTCINTGLSAKGFLLASFSDFFPVTFLRHLILPTIWRAHELIFSIPWRPGPGSGVFQYLISWCPCLQSTSVFVR